MILVSTFWRWEASAGFLGVVEKRDVWGVVLGLGMMVLERVVLERAEGRRKEVRREESVVRGGILCGLCRVRSVGGGCEA